MFEHCYIPRNIAIPLGNIAFPEMAGNMDRIIQKTRQAFSKRDSGAPVYITKDELDAFEYRNDIKLLQQEVETLRS